MSVQGILGKKVGMTQMFDEKGDVHPVTVLKAGPCVITQLKTLAKDGYDAAQIGYVDFVKASKVNKAMTGHFAKSNVPPVRVLREVAIDAPAAGESGEQADGVKAGDRVLVDIFADDKFVDIIGTSKGRGFAGVIRRHAFGGGPKSHGHMFQVQGSIGASSFPSRVFPGQRMPGHMGHEQVTIRNLRIRGIDLDDNLLMVEGAVPGPRDGYVLISKAKAPPRERRGFGGAGTIDPLKASKKASAKKK
ncbi:50S ribosomal protein L3 [Edaphobacter sp. 12200R-103]|uniref:50S ribosomal protein L3 n=1 Tax=Edaphobacter sp. 12200R-103 TaxID=2703788 RepID=UPI00138BE127|nr:50S ribosomal protein L3 [Edaphobacter sp. 12200R-103]QHS53475.1 50S ribosomal protein L3 [Edaphobacter sp. 12200R-103]